MRVTVCVCVCAEFAEAGNWFLSESGFRNLRDTELWWMVSRQEHVNWRDHSGEERFKKDTGNWILGKKKTQFSVWPQCLWIGVRNVSHRQRERTCVCVTVTVMITVAPQIHHQCFFVFSSADALDAYCSLKASASNKFLRLNSKRLVRAFVWAALWCPVLSQENIGTTTRPTISIFDCHVSHLLSFRHTQTWLTY